ncbi:MAG TPA: shikimate dehydrogenase [Gaiellaceae bacterium]|nr:shikimate dehydrogenase [Gaiellaceae bacterium]
MRNPPTALFALLGSPVAGNPTGAMIEAACRSVGLDEGRYVSIDVADEGLAGAVSALRTLGVTGFHVTIPHKVAVRTHVDRLTSAAEATGAVNCVKREASELVGDNTDGRGFVASLEPVVALRGARVLVLGAGGAARAVAVESALAGAASILVANRSPARAAELVELVHRAGTESTAVPWAIPLAIPAGTDIVVNATSVGMLDADDAVAVEWSGAEPGVAADVVIRPSTRFLEDAAGAGWTPVDGLGMLIEQAAAGFRWWTGREPHRDVMRAALADALG